MAYKDLGIQIGWTLNAYHPVTEEYQKVTVVGHWEGDKEMRVFDQEDLEWITVSPCSVMGASGAGPIVTFRGEEDAPVPILLEKNGTRYILHYQIVNETEKAICVSLDGSDWCNCWIPKSVIRGKTRQQSPRDPERMKTPIADWWARQNESSGGPII